MPDYGIPPNNSTSPTGPEKPDAAKIAELLATLAAIPADQLPNERDRRALAMLIKAGYIDNLYHPHGDPHYVIAWRRRTDDVDPRQRLSDWIADRRAYERDWQRRYAR